MVEATAEIRAAVVQSLRAAAETTRVYAAREGGPVVFFPAKEGAERQPVELSGYVPVADVAELIQYVADMLED